jgi:DNA-binding CsgD family transcriptional regulator
MLPPSTPLNSLRMSPRQFQAFQGMPGTCALARDLDFKLLWCDSMYAKIIDKDPATLLGSSLWDVLPRGMADERARLMETAQEGKLVTFYQFFHGMIWLTRCWPLDLEAFNQPGYFIMMTRLCAPDSVLAEKCEGIQIVQTADLRELSRLTRREREVFYYLAMGLTVMEVAKTVVCSPKTIERHAVAIHRKLDLTNRAELVRLAVERGVTRITPLQWAQFRQAM